MAATATTATTRDVVRRAVLSVVDSTPELRDQPVLRRRLTERMLGVSQAAADLLAEERRLTDEIDRRPKRPRSGPQLAAGQAASDFHGRTAVNSTAGVLRATRDAIDFPGFVTSLISGVFQAMTTSSIQQLQAVADLLDAVSAGASDFANSQVPVDRAVQWATNRFPGLTVERSGTKPRLVVSPNGEMPEPEQLKAALEATDDEVSTVDEDELEETLLPLVRRKLGRDRQQMLATMILMGLQRIVVDEGRIHASMNLQVDARSVAEQQEASRFDTRVTTSGSGSFGMGMWGASASMSATVGYVTSDEKYSREDIAVRAGLRSSVDVAFHTEPLQIDRMASKRTVAGLREKSMVPEAEQSLLVAEERKTSRPQFEPIPPPPGAPDPGSDEQRQLRAKKDFGPADSGGGGGADQGGGGGGGGGGEGGHGGGGGDTAGHTA